MFKLSKLSSGSLDELQNEVAHELLLNVAVAVLELLEALVEVLEAWSIMTVALQNLGHKVCRLDVVEMSQLVSVILSPKRVNLHHEIILLGQRVGTCLWALVFFLDGILHWSVLAEAIWGTARLNVDIKVEVHLVLNRQEVVAGWANLERAAVSCTG